MLTEGVCAAAVVCVVGGVCFRRLSGERSICLLSDPVGVLAPDLQAITTTKKKNHTKTPQRTSEGVVALNTYMVTGLGARGDGDTLCSRSWVCPNPWLCGSDRPSCRSKSAGRGDRKSPVGDSQVRSPLLAYSSSIWVAARLRAWESTSMNWPTASLIKQIPLNPSNIRAYSVPYFLVWIHHTASSDLTLVC